jgi:hypothetical protein
MKKNIHILETEQPSRLHKAFDKTFILSIEPTTKNDLYNSKPQNIYITSSEEIKKGDWCLDKFNQRWKLEDNKLIAFDNKGVKRFSTDNVLGHECKKIILTTDTKLIADGIQAIDDEFLEWFCQNPDCEFVETLRYEYTIKEMLYQLPLGTKSFTYKIIIPLEGPKQETRVFGTKDDKSFWLDKPIQEGHHDKQETLEEAAEKYAQGKSSSSVFQEAHKKDFIAGANYQAERMYSEEDLDTFRRFMIQEQNFSKSCLDVFVRQFKKK